MNHAWTALAAIGAVAAAITPFLVHRHQQAARRAEARMARLQAQYESDLRAIQNLMVCLDRIRTDLQTVLVDGPLCASRLDALGLAERLTRLEAPLKSQLFGRTCLDLLHERVLCILRNPYPGQGEQLIGRTADEGGRPADVDIANWQQQVRQAIGRGATQQAAAHAALDSLRGLTTELQRRQLELASKVFTLVGR